MTLLMSLELVKVNFGIIFSDRNDLLHTGVKPLFPIENVRYGLQKNAHYGRQVVLMPYTKLKF